MAAKPGNLQSVTIVILTRNGERTIGQSLNAIRSQRTSYGYEVLVIDSGSVDGTVDRARANGARVHEIPSETFNYGLTKNLAVDLANGDVLVFLSQDNIPLNESWLEQLMQPFAGGNVDAVQGLWVGEGRGYYWWRTGHFWHTREAVRWNEKYGFGLSSTNLAVRRRVLRAIPFRAVPMGEDKLLQRDLLRAGCRIEVASSSLVIHAHDYTLRTLCKRIENEGLGMRMAGATYSRTDAVRDLLRVSVYLELARGLRSHELTQFSELVFPFVRPVMVYKGINHTREYEWEQLSVRS